ncbi:MAG TPA: sigma-54 dependent transcriptional regulator [Gemmatimonadales bacterium]
MTTVKTILCVEDDPATAALYEHALNSLGYGVVLSADGGEALAIVASRPIDLILADWRMPSMTALDLLDALAEAGHRIPVIIATGQSSIEHAVQAMRRGAVDYLTKPVRLQTLELTVQHALDYARLREENETFREEITRIETRRKIVGRSRAMRELQDAIATVAPTRAAVLIEGESGTGKELVARSIHEQSGRRERPFITVNCAALPDGLVESALFGHEKGAFTGATSRSAGAFERAHTGTLLLDEVSEMRLDLQAKLLRAIQEQEFERVGGRELIHVDVRIVATTNRRLRDEVDAGRFRADLYYRLQVVPLFTPSLRDRTDDIPALVQHFLQRATESTGVSVPALSVEAMAFLQAYPWPGNIRELANAIERAVILSRGRPLAPEFFGLLARSPMQTMQTAPMLPAKPVGDGDSADLLPINLADLERIAIQRALGATGGNRTRAARLLGISERTLRNKLNVPPLN